MPLARFPEEARLPRAGLRTCRVLLAGASLGLLPSVIAAAVPRHCTAHPGLIDRAACTLRRLPASGSDPGAACDIESRFTTRSESPIRRRGRHLTDYFRDQNRSQPRSVSADMIGGPTVNWRLTLRPEWAFCAVQYLMAMLQATPWLGVYLRLLSVPADLRRVHGCARRSVRGTLRRVCTPGQASPARHYAKSHLAASSSTSARVRVP
jgi:hypothetical protein